jgi:hypothetical protein
VHKQQGGWGCLAHYAVCDVVTDNHGGTHVHTCYTCSKAIPQRKSSCQPFTNYHRERTQDTELTEGWWHNHCHCRPHAPPAGTTLLALGNLFTRQFSGELCVSLQLPLALHAGNATRTPASGIALVPMHSTPGLALLTRRLAAVSSLGFPLVSYTETGGLWPSALYAVRQYQS